MIFLTESIKYVMSDEYFWPSMAVIVMVSMFIGSLVYNGDLKQIKKAIFVLITYSGLLATVNFARLIDVFGRFSANHVKQPLASIVTIFFVTLFYFLGMFLGVFVTGIAHKKCCHKNSLK